MGEDISDLRERVIRLEVRNDHVEKSVDTLKERLISHMEREEHSFGKIQKALEKLDENDRKMDKEIAASFKERDARITALEKSVIKIFSYAMGAFTVLSIIIEYVLKVI